MPVIFPNRSRRRSCDVVVDGDVRSVVRYSTRGERLLLCGDIDRTTVGFVRDGLVQALHDRRISIIDLTGIGVFGSDAMRLFEELSLQQRYTVVVPPHVERVLRATDRRHLMTASTPVPSEATPVVYDLVGRRRVTTPAR